MSSPQSDSYDSHTRKRVGKACDRCRLKKSKCDGASPCSRCKVDNAICVFGERKKSQDKVYPKGYVEMLEQQQSQLVAGTRKMYRMLLHGESWPGARLHTYQEGQPLTHDILERLDVLHMTGENPVGPEAFEDNLEQLQRRLMEENGASYTRQRRSSPSTDSDPGLAHSESPQSTPPMRTSSVTSSASGSRKRSSPATPPPAQHSNISLPAKHRRYAEPETMPHFQDSWIMPSPENEQQADFILYNSFDSGMMGPGLINPIQTMNGFQNLPIQVSPWGAQDDDFNNFMNSGLHPALG